MTCICNGMKREHDTWHDIIPTTDPMTSLQGFAFYAPLDMMTFDYMGTLGRWTIWTSYFSIWPRSIALEPVW